MTQSVSKSNEFEALAGSELSAVSFVRDYVELHFDGPVLRVLAWPVVMSGNQSWRFPETGSRDALCQLIGRTVESVAEETDRLVVCFIGKAKVVIPKADAAAGPEVAQFVPLRDGKSNVAAMITWENSLPSNVR